MRWASESRSTATGLPAPRDAVRAGADSLEHATDMDDATIADMVQRKTWYVPTIDHNRYYVTTTSCSATLQKQLTG